MCVRDWRAMLLTEIDHVAIAVRDLEAAIDYYARAFGATVDHREVVESDGVEEALLKVADSYVQLLTPTRDDSPVAKALDKRGEGLHHVGYRVADCAAALESMKAAGATPIDAAPRPGSRGTTVAFIHPKGSFGTLIELVQEYVSSVPAAVLWDMDGTLIDTEPYWIRCEHELVAAYGGRWTDEDATSIVGFDLLDAAEVIRTRGGVPLRPHDIVEKLSAAVTALAAPTHPVATGSSRAARRPQAARRPVRPRHDVVAANSPTRSSRQLPPGLVPDRDHRRHGDERQAPSRAVPPGRRGARVDPLACVAIEDSPTGIASAEAAGCVVVGVRNLLPIPEAPHAWCCRRWRVSRRSCSASTSSAPRHLRCDRHPANRAAPPASRAATSPALGLGARRGVVRRRSRPPSSLLVAGGVWWFAIRDTEPTYEPGAVQRPRLGSPDGSSRTQLDELRAAVEPVPPDLAVLVRGHRRSRRFNYVNDTDEELVDEFYRRGPRARGSAGAYADRRHGTGT